MRLRNVPDAKNIIENSSYIIKDYKEYKGRYKELFNNNNPIHIEIGTGKGNFIIGMAKMYPNINFIGIEKYDSVLCKAVEKLNNIELPNLRLIRMDANHIEEVFNKEINTIYLNFSDPWPKNRQEKRRLSSENFLKKYDDLFVKVKVIVMKTDNRKLFEYSIVSFTNYNYKIEELSLNLHNDDISNNIMTEYEEKFVLKGNPIYMIRVYK